MEMRQITAASADFSTLLVKKGVFHLFLEIFYFSLVLYLSVEDSQKFPFLSDVLSEDYCIKQNSEAENHTSVFYLLGSEEKTKNIYIIDFYFHSILEVFL